MKPLITDVVEDSNLQSIRCSICSNFLSVKPISFNTNTGSNVCGRCIIKTDTTKLQHNSSYELLAKQYNFPCTYETRGCSTLASIDELYNHEKTCTFRVTKCFCSWLGNSFNFIKHYEKEHAELLIESGDTFSIEDGRSCFLLKSRGLYFRVTYLCDDIVLQIHVTGLTIASQEAKPTFTTLQYGSDTCFDVELDTLQKFYCNESSSIFILSVDISDEYVKNICRTIVCPTCSIQMTPPILRCSVGHLTCLHCTDDWLDFCQQCDTEREFTCDSELQCIALAVQYTCKWKKCGKIFSCNKIREHEQACTNRIFKCWHISDCNWRGHLNKLVAHEANCKKLLYGVEDKCPFFLDVAGIIFSGTINKFSICHMITYNCCFNVITEHVEGATSLFINLYDIYGFGWFRFIAELKHVQDINCPFNKTFELKHTHGGLYKVNIPDDDIAKFGGTKFYHITLSVILRNEEERRISTNRIYERFKNFKA